MEAPDVSYDRNPAMKRCGEQRNTCRYIDMHEADPVVTQQLCKVIKRIRMNRIEIVVCDLDIDSGLAQLVG